MTTLIIVVDLEGPEPTLEDPESVAETLLDQGTWPFTILCAEWATPGNAVVTLERVTTAVDLAFDILQKKDETS